MPSTAQAIQEVSDEILTAATECTKAIKNDPTWSMRTHIAIALQQARNKALEEAAQAVEKSMLIRLSHTGARG